MNKGILIDTDILIDYLKGYPAAVLHLQKISELIKISVITYIEVLAGVKGKGERKIINALFQQFPPIEISISIAGIAGEILNKFQKSHGIGIADAMIAATAISEELELQTLNTKHFQMILDIKAPYKKG